MHAAPISRRALLIGSGTSLFAIDAREQMPKFSAKTLDSERITNDTLKGHVAIFQFWATWCGYCRRDEPAVETIVREFALKGVAVIAVNVGESRPTVVRYLERNPRTCKIVLNQDTNLPALFDPDAFPMYVVVDREGKIAARQTGAGGEDALRGLLAKTGIK